MTTPKKEKINDGRPFFWMDVERFQAIRSHIPHRKFAPVLTTYAVLAEVANGTRGRRFQTYHSSLCELTGLSPATVRSALRILEAINIVRITTPRRAGAGRYAPIHVELTKGKYHSETVDDDALRLAVLPRVSPPLSANSAHTRGSLINKKLEAKSVDPLPPKDEKETSGPASDQRTALGLTPRLRQLVLSFAPSVKAYQANPHRAIAHALRISADYGEETTYAATLWAVEKGKDNPLAYAETTIKNLDPSAAPPWKSVTTRLPSAVVDEEATLFQDNTLYRQLSDDLTFAPFHALNRIRDVAPQFNISVDEFAPLRDAIPKDQQVALIRRFVALTLRASAVPADA